MGDPPAPRRGGAGARDEQRVADRAERRVARALREDRLPEEDDGDGEHQREARHRKLREDVGGEEGVDGDAGDDEADAQPLHRAAARPVPVREVEDVEADEQAARRVHQQLAEAHVDVDADVAQDGARLAGVVADARLVREVVDHAHTHPLEREEEDERGSHAEHDHEGGGVAHDAAAGE